MSGHVVAKKTYFEVFAALMVLLAATIVLSYVHLGRFNALASLTIAVSYKGKTYYVCCSGCRDLFNENPEAILAEAAERQRVKGKETR